MYNVIQLTTTLRT